ncbi:hypothetical protein JXR93_04280 [bacterium]|nr:hypothetical protein [bacterium]
MRTFFILLIIFSFFQPIFIFGNKYYDEAQIFFDMVQFDDALKKLDDALNKVENNEETLQAIYLLRAKIFITLNRETEAKNAFLKILLQDNSFELDQYESPKILDFFQNVKKRFTESLTVQLDPPQIMFTPVTSTSFNERFVISAIISNINESRDARIYYRMLGYSKYLKSDLTPLNGDTFEGILPMPQDAPKTGGFVIEYYIGVTDFQGNLIASYPNPESPVLLSVSAQKEISKGENPISNTSTSSDSVFTKWWFWTIVVGVVGAGVGTYFLLSPEETESSKRNLSFSVTLP